VSERASERARKRGGEGGRRETEREIERMKNRDGDVKNQNIVPTDDPLRLVISRARARARAISLPDRIKYDSNSRRVRRKGEKERKNRKKRTAKQAEKKETWHENARGKMRRSAVR